jgi:hypothetical protein
MSDDTHLQTRPAVTLAWQDLKDAALHMPEGYCN